MISIFASKAHFISFYACGILCTVYFVTSVLCAFYWYKNSMSIVHANVYALILSIPFMPFMMHANPNIGFSPWILTFFMFSNLFWQIIFLMYKHKEKFDKIIIPLSLCNISAWIMMSVINYLRYNAIAQLISSLGT